LKITVGIPAFNEEKNIASIISRLKVFTDSIIVCDDGSSDMTAKIAEDMGAILIKHPKNLGYGAAIRTIFLKAKDLESDILVTLDGDGQHEIVDVEKILKPIEKNQADIVIGSRFLDKKSDVPKYRELGINVITKVTNVSIKNKLTDAQSGLRAYSNKVLSEIAPSDSGMGISTEILIKSSSKGFRIVEVPITISYAGETSTQNPVSHGTSVLFSTIKYISIEHPLRFYGIPAFICLTVGLFFTYLAVQFYTEFGKLSTNLTILSAGTVLVGVMLAITAILLYSLVSVVREKK
jgi:glycosyltransferase involved in cell wall biosynthesis